MRVIPTSLQETLDGGASTLARCWRVTRSDGLQLGFTDHDRPLSFDGTLFEPESGFTPSAIELATGLSVDTHTVSGALQSGRIVEADIQKGLYDGAEVELFLVDWLDISSRIQLSKGRIGEIRRSGVAFEAEVTGLSDQLNQPIGNAYLHSCSCRLGEPKCGVDLMDPAFNGTATLVALGDPQQLTVTGLTAFAEGLFTGGLLTWTSGQNSGQESQVKSHLAAGTETLIELWFSPAMPAQVGDQFQITAGCNKTAEMCADLFGNIENFRGFPHIPGDDVAASYPSTGGTHDGGSLFNR